MCTELLYTYVSQDAGPRRDNAKQKITLHVVDCLQAPRGDDGFLSNRTHCLRNLASDVSWGLTGLDLMGEVPTEAPLIANLFLLTLPESDMKSQNFSF